MSHIVYENAIQQDAMECNHLIKWTATGIYIEGGTGIKGIIN